MSFIKIIEQIVAPILEEIIQHPFLKKLSAGTLDKKVFHFYLEQDYYYLMRYTEALLILSEKTCDFKHKIFLKSCAESCVHEPAFEIKNTIVNDDSRKTNACVDYINFIKKSVSTDYCYGLSSVFSCFYIYCCVAKKMYPANHNNNFITWFNTYTSDLFSLQTKTMIELVKKEYNACNKNKKMHMLDIIKQGARHEFNFWDATYQ